jgi:hypothetical protein
MTDMETGHADETGGKNRTGLCFRLTTIGTGFTRNSLILRREGDRFTTGGVHFTTDGRDFSTDRLHFAEMEPVSRQVGASSRQVEPTSPDMGVISSIDFSTLHPQVTVSNILIT